MDSIAVLIPYFNYFKNRHITANHSKVVDHYRRQGLPVYTFEALLENQTRPPGENTFQFKSKSILFQKERLVNMGIDYLANDYKFVAWIDNDILLPDGWAEMAVDKLRTHPLVQLWDFLHFLELDGKSLEASFPGMAYAFERNGNVAYFDQAKMGFPGAAWAGSTDVLKGVGVYDRYINCGGDTLFSLSICQLRADALDACRPDFEGFNHVINRHVYDHSAEWDSQITTRLREATGSSDSKDWFTYLPHAALHLFHGAFRNRQYIKRHRILIHNNFDPATDLVLNDDGLLEWASNKPKLHEGIKEIFQRPAMRVFA